MKKINLKDFKEIVILTGAGVSAPSGLKTYRGAGGVWDENDVEFCGHVSALEKNPESVWRLFGKLRHDVLNAEPNSAHEIIAKIEGQMEENQNFTLITQNVDGFHQASGSRSVIELHGTIHYTKCSNNECQLDRFKDREGYQEKCPICELCSFPLRPDIVLFGEQIPVEKDWLVKRALRECDLFLSIGTSGTVWPAASYVRSAKYVGARTISINMEKARPRNKYFDEEYIGDASKLLAELFN